MDHIRSLFKDEPKVSVQQFQKLTVNFCKDIDANFIIRGLRDSKDFQYEKSIAHMNKEISGIETVFFLTEQKATQRRTRKCRIFIDRHYCLRRTSSGYNCSAMAAVCFATLTAPDSNLLLSFKSCWSSVARVRNFKIYTVQRQ